MVFDNQRWFKWDKSDDDVTASGKTEEKWIARKFYDCDPVQHGRVYFPLDAWIYLYT